jgi:YidC/Oxa1 family membrane protein insertase
MRHAPFFGWIKDLSAPDPTSVFNLFGALPFDPPTALMIGIWPLIMGVTMWLQMQMNPPQPDPVQQQVFQWMPIMFTFMMASFPAGLVIYWAVNNTLTIAQQTVINKRLGVDIHLKDNIVRQWQDIKGFVAGLMGKETPPAASDKAASGNAATDKPKTPDKPQNEKSKN